MTIFGHHFPHQQVWIGGGLIAAAVAVVVWLRARAASAAQSADQGAAAPADYGTGGGMTVAAPTSGVAGDYQQQLDDAQLQSQALANKYQSNLVNQQQRQFNFQQSQLEALAPAYQAEQRAQLAVQTHYATAASKAPVSCPGTASVRTDPTTGQLYCRQKTSGSILGLPIGDITRAVSNFVYGAEAAAPTIGYGAAQQAAQYELGTIFKTPTRNPSGGSVSTPEINPAVQNASVSPSPVTGTPMVGDYEIG